MSKIIPIGLLLDEIRMEFFLDKYQDYMKRKDAQQITFDEFCDEYYTLNLN